MTSAQWREGYLAGLQRALEIAKDYTGQGILIQIDLKREIAKS